MADPRSAYAFCYFDITKDGANMGRVTMKVRIRGTLILRIF